MLGVIGHGMVGQVVTKCFTGTPKIVLDPHKEAPYPMVKTIREMVAHEPWAIFVCVPTDDGDNFTTLTDILDELTELYNGLIIVKSTCLPNIISKYTSIVYNPEFLSRKTAVEDFQNPHIQVFGGSTDNCNKAIEFYELFSTVEMNKDNIFIVDIATAALVKYTLNTFYATKVTFMNAIYEIAQQSNVDYNTLTDVIEGHPWFGSNHFTVPGPDGLFGFGGPCLPKDTKALAMEYDVELLKHVLKENLKYRSKC